MTDDDPVVLDTHRGMGAQKATELRRELHEVQNDQAALRHRQAELERYLFASPSVTWQDAAGRARYLIELFAATPEARDPRRQQVIASALADLARLSEPPGGPHPTEPPAANSR